MGEPKRRTGRGVRWISERVARIRSSPDYQNEVARAKGAVRAMLRRLLFFVMWQSAGVALVGAAYLLPRRHGPEVPAVLFLLGIAVCIAGLGYGISAIPGARSGSVHHWSGRVTAPTSGKQAVVWAIPATVRERGSQGGDGAGGG